MNTLNDEQLARSPTRVVSTPTPSLRDEMVTRFENLSKLDETYRPRSTREVKKDKTLNGAQPLVDGILYQGRMTLLSAKEKTGKTTFTFYLAAKLAEGGEIFGRRVRPQVVLFVSLEEALGDIKTKLSSFEVTDRGQRLFFSPTLHHPTKSRTEVLNEIVDALKPTTVIVDTLSAFGAGVINDENAAGPWLALLQPLHEMAHRKGISLLLLHHSQKNGTEARGSSVIPAVPDHLVEMSRRKNDETVRELDCKGRYGNKKLYLRFDPVACEYSHIPQVGDNVATVPVEKRILTDAEIESAIAQLCTHESERGPTQETFKQRIKAKAGRIDAAAKRLVDRGELGRRKHGRHMRYSLIAHNA